MEVVAQCTARVLCALAALAAGGCAGTLRCFYAERDFEAYVTRVNLRNRSLVEDRALLTADGYVCADNQSFDIYPATVVCTTSCRACKGEHARDVFIALDPSDEGPNRTKVRWMAIVPA